MPGAAWKVGLLSTLYFSQGLPFGFFTQALPVLLRKEGYSLEEVGLSSLLAIPWAGKFLWAPLVDRYGWARFGRRRSWIVPLQLLMVLTLVAIALRPPGASLRPLLVAVFFTNLLAATQDIATDSLAVDMLRPSERGLANGVQVAGYRLGMIVGGGALLILFDRLGWSATFAGMALAVVLASGPILLARERALTHGDAAGDEPAAPPPAAHFFSRPDAWRILGLLTVYKLGEAFAAGMLRPFLVDIGLTLGEIGWLLGTVGFVAGLAGALAGGALVNPLGRRRALLLFAALQAVSVAGYAALAALTLSGGAPGRGLLYAVCAAEHFASGMATAALFTLMMDWSRPGASATDYTVQASAVVVATGAAAAASGFSAQALGYAGHFFAATALAVLAPVAASRFFPPGAASPRGAGEPAAPA